MSEWYLDLDIDDAELMLKEAFKLEPENILYQWGIYAYIENSVDEKKSKIINKKLFDENTNVKEKLRSKGALGSYILEMIVYTISKRN